MKKNNLFKILFLSGVLAVSPSFAQAQQDTTKKETPSPIQIDYMRPVSRRIADIKIVGGEGYNPSVLISLSGLNVGDVVEVPGIAFSDAVRRFMRNGYFDNAQIMVTKEEGNNIWLEIHLKQRPKISSINYVGVKQSERKELEQRTGLRAEMQLTPNIVDRTKQIITKYFEEQGYSNMAVEVEQQPDLSRQNHVLVTVNIDKKNKIKVDHIEFVGNKSLSDNALKASMKQTNEVFAPFKKGRLWSSIVEIFSPKKYIETEYKTDLEKLLARYHEAGYRDAEITGQEVTPMPGNDKRVKIRIEIDEGKKYYIKDLRFVGNTKYSSDYLMAVLGVKAGELYNQKKLEDRLITDEDAVSNLYYNNGYIFAHIDPIETHVTTDSVTLDLRVVEGPQATINKVLIKGNDLVYDNVIRRELFTKPGKLFSKEDLMTSWMSLNQLNQFDPEKSIPKPVPNPQDGTVDIEYNLEAKRSDKFELSFGWSQAGLIASVGIQFTNFSIYNLFHPSMYKGFIPQGDGQTLAVSATTNGRYYQQYSIQFMDPWFGGKRPNFFSTRLFYSRQTALDTKFYNNQIGSIGYNPYGYGSYGGYGGYGYGGYGYDGYGGYGGYGENTLLEKAYNPNQSLQILGGSITYGKRLNWPDNWFRFTTSLNYNYYLLRDWVYDTFEGFHDGSANDLNLQITFSRSSIDNPIYTRRGSDFSLSVSATPPYSLFDKVDYSNPRLPSADRYRFVEYHKWRFSGKVFTPLANPQTVQYTPVLMNRFDIGILGSYNPYKRSPFGTYYMGGDGMSSYVGGYMNESIGLRGYRNGSIAGGNYDYATAFVRLATELRVPILFQGQTNVWALAFLEAGNAWSNISDINPFNLKRSAGVGVRITLPMIGLLGLDWGYGFDRPDGSATRGGSNIHFILGQEF
ncbi:BamA/OMP85 family outer membrane protein [Porphyromonas circumdentaria]|nr:POTRA domain-containing protein [Porphyromonas circumdentaria]